MNFREKTFGLLLLLVGLLLPACRGMSSSKPPVHPNPNMDNVAYIEAQEPSDFWADGRGMRPQVDGTVAVGSLHADPHYDHGRQGENDWATSLPPQLPLTHAFVDRGRERFEIYCTPCHGEAGLANGGIVPQRAALTENAWAIPSLHDPRPRDYAIGQLFDVISNGYNTMPAYAAQIPIEDRWAIATYVRALQVAHEMPLDELPSRIATAQGWR